MIEIDRDNLNILEPTAFKAFLTGPYVVNVAIIPFEYDLVVTVEVASKIYLLGRSRGGLRLFKTIDGAAATLKQYGIENVVIYLNDWVPKTAQKINK